jgi:hypothetical protein
MSGNGISVREGAGYSLRSSGGGGPGTVEVQDEGVAVNSATTLNFIGAGVTATDAGGGVANVTIPGGGTESLTIVFTGVSGEAISAGEPVRFDRTGTPGRLLRGQATGADAADIIGVCKNAVAGAGLPVTVYLGGEAPLRFDAAPAATDNGKRVYLSAASAGRATLTPPAAPSEVLCLIGFLTGADGVSTTPNAVVRPTIIAII